MPSAWSRRRPWPWSVRVRYAGEDLEDAFGLMLEGELVGKKLQSMAGAIPNAQEYGLDDLYRERSAAFTGPLLGMGQATQRSHQLGRYHYGLNIWVSGLLRGKGPRFRVQTAPLACAPLLGFIDAKHGTGGSAVTTLFAYGGRCVLRRVDDSDAGWVVSRDAGSASFVHESAEVFTHAGTTPAERLYVAGRTGPTDATGQLWAYDGATWTNAPVPARFLCRIDSRLIRGWGNQISSCSADPLVAGSWTGAITIGDGADLISGLGAVNGVLVVFTRTGRVFTLNGDGTANDLFPGLARTPPSDPLDAPGGQVEEWLSGLWFRSGDAFYHLTLADGATIQDVGPGRLAENAGPVMGPAQCFTGHQAWYGFLGIYNPLNGNSYLLQYGDWVPQEAGEDPAYRFVDTLHGALVVWTGKRVTSLGMEDLVAGNPRLYAGMSDGTLGYCLLPRTGPNPFARDAAVEFTQDPTLLQWPLHTMLAAGDTKEYLGVSVYGPRVTSDDYVRLSYRINPTAQPVVGMGPATPLSPDFTAPGQEWPFPPSSFGAAISLEESYGTSTSLAAAGSPIVLAMVLRERLHPKFRLEWTMRPIGGNRVARRDGMATRQTAEQILLRCQQLASRPETVVVETPEETQGGWSNVTYQQTLLPERERYGTEWMLDMSFVGFRTADTYGTIDRMGDLTIDGLGERQIDDLGTL